MKKQLYALGALSAIAAPLATAISCGSNPNLGNAAKDEKVAFITDGGSITDHSFNQGTLEGVQKYATGKDGKTYKVYQVANEGGTHADFVAQYNAAKASGAKSFVLPGFNHGPALYGSPGDFKKWWTDNNLTDRPVVGIDLADTVKDKFYGITFKTKQSAFLAAVHLGYQLNKKFPAATGDFKVATFGGVDIPTVTDYMNGFNAGIEWFNTSVADPSTSNGSTKQRLKLVRADGSDFSGTFAPGGGKDIADKLIAKGAVAIMAVAGPQTGDVVQAIKEKGKTGQIFAVGVDSDQSKIYGEDVVIVSAIKGLKAATNKALDDIDKGILEDTIYDLDSGDGFVGAIESQKISSGMSATEKTNATNAAKNDALYNHPISWVAPSKKA